LFGCVVCVPDVLRSPGQVDAFGSIEGQDSPLDRITQRLMKRPVKVADRLGGQRVTATTAGSVKVVHYTLNDVKRQPAKFHAFKSWD